MTWHRAIPDVDSWQPAEGKDDTLRNSLMVTCQLVQARIAARADAEIRFNIRNFDSGSALEDIVREELTDLLPNRYEVSAGVINDRMGRTAGDCDLIVRDPNWSPVIKTGATGQSRRFHFPIEGVYAVTEIKQSLGRKELDAAMKKLVMVARLERPDNPYGHITENQHITNFDKPGATLNPLHTTIFATRLPSRTNFNDVVNRFAAINAKLSRNDMVKMLCVLGHGTAWYSVESGNPYNATYMADADKQLILQVNHRESNNSFYRYYVEILAHLTRSVLGLTGITACYGEPPPARDTRAFPKAAFNTGSASHKEK